jgi:hypothetical protein
MLRAPRVIAFLAFASLALVAAGCSSNNKGKIEGKWKFVSIPGMDEGMLKTLEAQKIFLYMEFTPSGEARMGAAANDPELQKKIDTAGEKTSLSFKYKLLSGDGVEFYDLPAELREKGGGLFGNKDRARTKVKIDGDTLTMTDDDGKTGKFTRWK